MQQIFSKDQLIHIRDQATIYQCACPAQVCVAISLVRDLYAYQQKCLTATNTDRAVHERISTAAARAHAELEHCLQDVLQIEGWDMKTLDMPAYLHKRLLDEL